MISRGRKNLNLSIFEQLIQFELFCASLTQIIIVFLFLFCWKDFIFQLLKVFP
ncbi:hypothetical protein BDF20DRAFT_845927 [Mycotypha africana]|uniref:uncharacterized protein n=1 Tax=Mycotypha africana TaxID=64632 RepID=UPI00230033B2|nr:uncharacterized protein BDF20DRAFT_845927 [Mycotypha africana]KAI8991708.1 hypothetical protein BDF20DRAFT_845927 [Mycotypha africana]